MTSRRATTCCSSTEEREPTNKLKLAAEKRLPYVAAFSDSANVVNQITRGWNKNVRATELYEEVKEALEPFKTWQLSRKVVASLFLSLDGPAEQPDGSPAI